VQQRRRQGIGIKLQLSQGDSHLKRVFQVGLTRLAQLPLVCLEGKPIGFLNHCQLLFGEILAGFFY
jgi:hypothetical protein